MQLPPDESRKYMHKLVVGRDGAGGINFVGKVISYTNRPTVTVQLIDGTRVTWPADQCQVSELTVEAVAKLISKD